MRVIAGELRGRRLEAPRGDTTRPTADRVREATFNALWSRGAIEGATVLDGFAGSGALGIEALSRGAEHCLFVERDRAALEALRRNLAALGLGPDRATVQPGDLGGVDGRWDLALLDPPYDFDGWNALLSGLAAGLAVCESRHPIEVPEPWVLVREKAYGGTVVTIMEREQEGPA